MSRVLGGRYQVLGVLGQGGMGTVYRCKDETLQAEWAVKEMRAPEGLDGAGFVEQFANEARLLAKLRHPNLPRVAAFFEEDGCSYMVMDLIHGETLATRLESHEPVPLEQACGWLDAILRVLEYMHAQEPPVLFRDLTPGNVMIDADGKPHLIDFGLARLLEPAGKTRPALKGYGSSGYAPPEQYGQASTEARSDLYGLAATSYHVLTGSAPPDSVHRLVDHEPLIEPWRLRADVSEVLSEWVLRGMALRPEDRFGSAREMREALEKASRGEPFEEALPAALLAEQFVARLAERLRASGWSPAPTPPEPYTAGFSKGRSKVWVRLVDRLDESAVQSASILASTQPPKEPWMVPTTSWFLVAGPAQNPVDAGAAATVRRGFRTQIVIPVDLRHGTILDSHVPKDLMDSNNLSDAVLNIRIAARA